MSEREPRSRKRDDLDPDPVAEAAAGGAPDTIVLHGYVGRSARADRLRLYVTEAMDGWIEVPREAVRRRERLPEGHPLAGRSALHVDRGARLELVSSRSVEADLLGGELSGALLAGADSGPVAVGTTITVTTTLPVTAWSYFYPNQCTPVVSRLNPWAPPGGCPPPPPPPPGCPGKWTFCWITLF